MMRRWGWLVLLVVPTLAWGQAVPTLPPNVSGLSGCTLANSVLQGGATVTCTATPTITSLTFASNTVLQSEAADTLGMYRSTNGQTINVYGSRTDGSNYQRLQITGFDSANNQPAIHAQSAGTGSVLNLDISNDGNAPVRFWTNGSFRWQVSNGGHWLPNQNNTVTSGDATHRPSQIFAGTSGIDTTGVIAPNTAGGAALGKAAVGFSQLYMDYTNTTTVGPVTINKAAMRVLVAAAGKSIVVTDSLVTAASHVICSNASATPTTPTVVSAVPAGGTFTLTVMQMPSVFAYDCFVVNAD